MIWGADSWGSVPCLPGHMNVRQHQINTWYSFLFVIVTTNLLVHLYFAPRCTATLHFQHLWLHLWFVSVVIQGSRYSGLQFVFHTVLHHNFAFFLFFYSFPKPFTTDYFFPKWWGSRVNQHTYPPSPITTRRMIYSHVDIKFSLMHLGTRTFCSTSGIAMVQCNESLFQIKCSSK